MPQLPPVERVSDIRLGEVPAFDAWFYTFQAENNIEHQINPEGVAGPEQLGFMVALAENQIYVPCPDEVFREVVESRRKRTLTPWLLGQYAAAWRIVVRLLRSRVQDRGRRRELLNYCRHRFQGSLVLGCILPSRLVKRLITTIINQMDGEDPWAEERAAQNRTQAALLRSPQWREALDCLPQGCAACSTLSELRRTLDQARLARLLYLAALSTQVAENIEDPNSLAASLPGAADAFAPAVGKLFERHPDEPRLLLYLCDTEGGLLYDLEVIRALLRQGHRVVLALKEGPLFLAPTMGDLEHDSLLCDLPGSHVLRDPAIGKNELLRRLREHRLLIISDGTSEILDLYRTSVTFARAWKECDVVLAKGRRSTDLLLRTSSEFTRDIFCFWQEDGRVRMRLRPRAAQVRKFGEADLSAKAAGIIREMRSARDQGKAVMFYSCIIGSIPGQTRTALEVAGTFVRHLRGMLDDVLVINPAEYFEPGMDGDDLMFMWEQVQRSGLINIWRFQSVEDIETSFALLGRKVPPAWSGKDATFSTGCTKEMRIALDMQRLHPELQIIGPGAEKFFRRSHYGVGKFFDAAITI